MKKKKILFLVKREVYATNIKQAMSLPGKIYEIMETSAPPKEEDKVVGFQDKKNGQK